MREIIRFLLLLFIPLVASKKYHTCEVSVLWDINYDLFYKYKLKLHSSLISMPTFFDARFVVTSTKNQIMLDWFKNNSVIVRHADKTTKLMSGANYKYFLTKLKLFDQVLMDSCDVIIYSDADIFFYDEGFAGILEACDEDLDVCMTSQARTLCVGLECCDYSPILVANSGVMVLRRPERVRDALHKTIDEGEVVFRRDQHLFGNILCNTDLIKFALLPDKFNANFNWDTMEGNPTVIHYTVGPDMLNPQIIPLDDPVYDSFGIFSTFKNYSNHIDPCYSQSTSCHDVGDHKCVVTTHGICVSQETQSLAPYKAVTEKVGFEIMVCFMQMAPTTVLTFFRECGLTCDLSVLLEETCFTPESFHPFLCVEYFSLWVYDVFIEKPYTNESFVGACGCANTWLTKCGCGFAVVFIGMIHFVRFFFIPCLFLSIICVWYFKGESKVRKKV